MKSMTSRELGGLVLLVSTPTVNCLWNNINVSSYGPQRRTVAGRPHTQRREQVIRGQYNQKKSKEPV